MAVYVLKAWVDGQPDELIVDELIQAADTASAIKAAKDHQVSRIMGQVKRAELRDHLSTVVWSLP